MSNVMPGGWSSFSWELTEKDKRVFEEAKKKIVGVDYTPYAAATQVVAGTHYCFICRGVYVLADLLEMAAKVYVYQPLSGDPQITQIVEIKP